MLTDQKIDLLMSERIFSGYEEIINCNIFIPNEYKILLYSDLGIKDSLSLEALNKNLRQKQINILFSEDSKGLNKVSRKRDRHPFITKNTLILLRDMAKYVKSNSSISICTGVYEPHAELLKFVFSEGELRIQILDKKNMQKPNTLNPQFDKYRPIWESSDLNYLEKYGAFYEI